MSQAQFLVIERNSVRENSAQCHSNVTYPLHVSFAQLYSGRGDLIWQNGEGQGRESGTKLSDAAIEIETTGSESDSLFQPNFAQTRELCKRFELGLFVFRSKYDLPRVSVLSTVSTAYNDLQCSICSWRNS